MSVDLDLTSFEAANDRLGEALDALASQPDERLFRDAVIKRFEFTYELCHKMLRRYLLLAAADPEQIQQMSFPDLIRTGNEHGLLLGNWETWSNWRKARGTTSHAYNEEKARQVVEEIPKFLEEARHLLERLKDRIGR
jgi:nucleotidyltransferase substrate binding protein (TIGR01987 family)